MNAFEIEGISFAPLSSDHILDLLTQRLLTRTKTFCAPVNLDLLRLANENKAFRQTLQQADVVFADGMPIVWLSKWSDTPIPERTAGCDLVYDLCQASHQHGFRIFMLGAAPGVAEKAKIVLEQRLPNIQIVGVYAPKAPELISKEANGVILEKIRDARPDILFVALGAPKQELWIQQHRAAINATLIFPCGGSIDFIAGAQKKAPQWLGRLGVEWLFRLLCNPSKFFRRYILQDVPFACRLVWRQLTSLSDRLHLESRKAV